MSVQNAAIYVAYSELHGKGVFAAKPIEPGEVIEICPVLLFPKSELPHIRKTILDDYYFDWGRDDEWFAVALGFGSIYNHSYTPNAEYDMDFEADTIDFFCIKPIQAGEEILVNYNGFPEDQTTVWFEKNEGDTGTHRIKPKP
jgi:hypothetical protein